MADYNYGLLTNMASGIREGMNTYLTMKNQQRQESMLENQIKNQEQDRQMKMMQQGLVQGEDGQMRLSADAERQKAFNLEKASREAREHDPSSEESRAMRGLIAQQTGKPVPNNISAAQLKSSQGFLGTIHRSDEMGIARDEARKTKAEGLQAKADEKELRLAVPGYERTGEVLPKEEEAMKIRKASSNAEQLKSKLTRLRELVKDKGSFEFGGSAGTEMESLATEIQLLAKGEDMYQLGVLAGPDLHLLHKITADPSSMSSLFTRDSTRLKQIDSQIKSIEDKLGSVTRASGYRPVGGQREEIKDINGKKYKKVPGGWEEIQTVGAR